MKAGVSGQDAFQGEPLEGHAPGVRSLLAVMGGEPDSRIGMTFAALQMLAAWAENRPNRVTFIRHGAPAPVVERRACRFCAAIQAPGGGPHLDGCLVGQANRVLDAVGENFRNHMEFEVEVVGAIEDGIKDAIRGELDRRKRYWNQRFLWNLRGEYRFCPSCWWHEARIPAARALREPKEAPRAA